MIYIWILVFILAGTFSYAGLIGAPWVPTRRHERDRLVELVDLRPGQVVYDLGAGNGAILFSMHDRFAGVRCIGYELSLVPYILGKIRLWRQRARYPGVELRYGNAYKHPISDADCVFIYLLEGAYQRVLKFLRSARLKPDATIIVQGWPLPDITYERHVKNEGCLSLYFYRGAQFASIA